MVQPPQNQNASNTHNASAEADAGEALSKCLLSQYRYCTAGLGFGLAYTLKVKPKAGKFVPLFVGGAVGSVADLVHGYTVACQEEVAAYNRSKEESEPKK